MPAFNDMGMAMLAQSRSLRHLDVSFTQITDGGVDHLARLPRLESLNLLGTGATGKALDSLKDMRKLRHLHLGGPYSEQPITDANLPGVHIVRSRGYHW
jgi:hypothetical protein